MLDLLIDIPLSVALYAGIVSGFRFLHPLHDQAVPLDPVVPLSETIDVLPPIAVTTMVESSRKLENLTVTFQGSETTQHDPLLGGHVPSDDVLERHFLQYLAMVFEALYPAPQESIQRRHHVQWIGHEVLQVLASESAYEDLIDRYESLQQPSLPLDHGEEPSIEPLDPLHVADLKKHDDDTVDVQSLLHLPEDSVLRRHVMHRLVSEVEALFPRPTDSVLRRHYDQWLNAEWHECLHV